MKRILGLLIATVMMTTAFAKQIDEAKEVIPFTGLSPEMTNDVVSGRRPDLAIECQEGTELPFKFLGHFGLFSVQFAPNLTFKIEKTCYLRFIPKRFNRPQSTRGYISYDLKSWDKLSSLRNSEMKADLGMSPDLSNILLKAQKELSTK